MPTSIRSHRGTRAREAGHRHRCEGDHRPGEPQIRSSIRTDRGVRHDGTLWPENPMPFQLAYAVDTLKKMAAEKPELNQDPMVQPALAGDFAKFKMPHNAAGSSWI